MKVKPLLPDSEQNGDDLHSGSRHGAVGGFPIKMSPHTPGLPVTHDQDALSQAEHLEGVGLTFNHGVEPDPRAAEYSEGNQNGPTANSVVHYVVVGHHADRIGAAFAGDGQP